jgi:hypothetical protein
VTDVGVGHTAVLPSLSLSTIYNGNVVPAFEQLKAETNNGVPDAFKEKPMDESRQEVSLLKFKSEYAGALRPNVSSFKRAVALQLATNGGEEHDMMVIQ